MNIVFCVIGSGIYTLKRNVTMSAYEITQYGRQIRNTGRNAYRTAMTLLNMNLLSVASYSYVMYTYGFDSLKSSTYINVVWKVIL